MSSNEGESEKREEHPLWDVEDELDDKVAATACLLRECQVLFWILVLAAAAGAVLAVIVFAL